MNAEMLARFSIALSVSTDKLLGLDLKPNDEEEKTSSIRYMWRIRDLDKLPEMKRRMILWTVDDLIRANS